jgi:hypothetical protein
MMQNSIPALLPRGSGYQFLLYGHSCSGVPGGAHEKTFASINAVVRRLQPQPEFILFLGDEIVGLTSDEESLREQWHYWLNGDGVAQPRDHTPLAYDEQSHDL